MFLVRSNKYFVSLILTMLILSSYQVFSKDKKKEKKSKDDKAVVDSTDSSFEEFIKRYFWKKKDISSYFSLSLDYGFGNHTFSNNILDKNLSLIYSVKLQYGFIQFFPIEGEQSRNYQSTEFIFIENASSHLKPSFIAENGITSDNWRFGLGYGNGFGYNLTKSSKLMLFHSSSWDWSHIDFEVDEKSDNYKRLLNIYDLQYKFGISFESGISLLPTKNIIIKLSYCNSLVFRQFEFYKWTGSSIIELINHRTMDYLSFELIRDYPLLIPILNFLEKSLVSAIFYNFRMYKTFFPFNSYSPLIYRQIKFGITGLI